MSRQRRNPTPAGSAEREKDFAQKTKSLRMKLRDHPALKIVSTPSWPPVWVHSRTEKVYGEVGRFTGTKINDAIPTAIFLTMKFEQKQYMGFLSTNDAVFCTQLNKLLNEHVGRSIEEIGDLDLSFFS